MQTIDQFLDYLEERLHGTRRELERIPEVNRSTPKALALEDLYHQLQACVLQVGYFQAEAQPLTGYGGRAPHVDQV